jgi:hypothetical protein
VTDRPDSRPKETLKGRRKWGELSKLRELEVYWTGDVPQKDDFGITISDEFVDGRMRDRTQWAMFAPQSWRAMGVGALGTGFGQKYRKQRNGRWLKVEG